MSPTKRVSLLAAGLGLAGGFGCSESSARLATGAVAAGETETDPETGREPETAPADSGSGPTGADPAETDADLPDGDSSGTGGALPPSDTDAEPPEQPFLPMPTGCVTTIDEGLHDFDCDGLVTTVNVPEVCTQEPCGVILDIHGASMTAQQQDNNTNLRALGTGVGFIVVQPTTDGLSWSAGHETRIMTGLFDVIDAFDADPKRIHVTGFSAGGGATWVILCTYPEVFASAAPAAATGQYVGSAPVCFGTEPPEPQMDILYMNGLTDPFESMDYVEQLVGKIVTDWAMGEPTMIDGDGTFERLQYVNATGTKFELLTHSYETDQTAVVFALGGHCYPGSTDHTPTEPGQLAGYGCKGDNAFHFGEVLVEFFLANPKP